MLQKTNQKNIGVLNDFKNQMTQDSISQGNWTIFKSPVGLSIKNRLNRPPVVFIDDVSFIESFLDKLYNREFTSILCGGLGLGVAPFLCEPFCDTIDVVEIDDEVIQLVNTAGYLSSKVNIIHDDIFTYKPQKKYDVILCDTWMDDSGNFYQEVATLIERYTPYLNEDGLLYLPFVDLLNNN